MDAGAPAADALSGRFEARLNEGGFIVTAEFRPPTTASADYLLEQAASIASRVDAVNVTDGAGARVHTSSLAVAGLLAREGYEPILQVTCRDRNRIALEGHLLGCAALGVHNVLCMRGDDPTAGDHPDAKGVFDLETLELIAMAATLRDKGTLLSGRPIDHPPHYVIGAVDTPVMPTADWSAANVIRKLEAGARFVQTQFCYDLAIIEAYAAALRTAGVGDQIRLLIGLGPIGSARSALWMREHLYGVEVPDVIVDRLDKADDPVAEGRRICVELIARLGEVEGIDGVHLMAVRDELQIVRVLDEAGLG